MRITGLKITNKDAADVVITAVEGGTNYWAEVKDYNWSTWYEKDEARSNETYSFDRVKDLPEDFVFVQIREDAEQVEPERFSNTWIPLTREVIEKGVRLCFERYPQLITVDEGSNGEVDFNVDADGADVIVQLAIFEEVIYA
jgi:hypothetical protein